ncbi:MAG: MiaB/RimO family radical SAM methylthiotransferase, partial [Ignavibacteria bacterium]|nr:MiaB/RimO family radical SAM methylthiotransferase [Ignavibacteria bacterium]
MCIRDRIEGVDLVLGAREKFRLFDYAENFEKRDYSCVFRSPESELTDFEYAYSSDSDSRTRAFLKIQDGCDYKCSFCTIPLARGKSRSMNFNEIPEHVKMLLDSGYKEIVLTGVNTGDYSSDKKKFIDVLYLMEKLDVPRVRISSVEPNLISDEIIKLVKSSQVICRHFHIPLQSGDDKILRLMRRRYNSSYYRELVFRIKSEIPEACIGADVITGFPGESDESFKITCSFLEDLPVNYLHVFTYSERRDTVALKLSGRVDVSIRKRRTSWLRQISEYKRNLFYSSNKGKYFNVLFEKSENNSIKGFTDNYIRVELKDNKDILKNFENQIRCVKISGLSNNIAIGEI